MSNKPLKAKAKKKKEKMGTKNVCRGIQQAHEG